MESRVKLPPKMSSDHRTLMELMDRVRDLSTRLTSKDNVRSPCVAAARGACVRGT
jgi:hypothetical protein